MREPKVELRIRELMQEKAKATGRVLTQNEVAEAIGMHPSRFTYWVNNRIGRVELDTLTKLCKYFECSPGDLLILQ